MKKTLLGSLILLAFAGNVQAARNPIDSETAGTVTFFGKVVENTCKVKTDSRNLTVTLNDVGKTHLTAPGNTAMPTPFTITLENCNVATANNKPKATKVGAYFYSWENVDKDNSYTLKNTHTGTDKANNVNIQLTKADGVTAISVVGKDTTDFTTQTTNPVATAATLTNNHISSETSIATGDIKLHYSAQYYATGQSEAGKVQSSVNFEIAYE
ncbi:Major fimbrial subunit precursor [Haemophilus influenzae]|nr:Major fimbrial subunit precursor [Haemophilus influenzae]